MDTMEDMADIEEDEDGVADGVVEEDMVMDVDINLHNPVIYGIILGIGSEVYAKMDAQV